MPLPEKLLEKLVCPQCKGKLDYDQAAATLTCPACKLAYPITDDIPVLLVDEAKKL